MKTKTLVFAAIAFLVFAKHSNAQICDSTTTTNDSKQLNVKLVRDMITMYRTNQLATINQKGIGEKSSDAHSVWFSLETLESFIKFIKDSVAKYSPNTQPCTLGLRIYYSAYPSDTFWNTVPEYNQISTFRNHATQNKYGKLHTVVMIPTILNKGVNTDFEPTNPITYNNLDEYKKLVGTFRRSKWDVSTQTGSINNTLKRAQLINLDSTDNNTPNANRASQSSTQNKLGSGTKIFPKITALGVILPFQKNKNGVQAFVTSGSGSTAQNHGDLIPPNGIIGEGF